MYLQHFLTVLGMSGIGSRQSLIGGATLLQIWWNGVYVPSQKVCNFNIDSH